MKPCPFLLVWLAGAVIVDAAAAKEDALCRQLWDSYLARAFKVNTSTKNAAIHIVAERGRNTGFWQVVLAELRKNDPGSEANCVKVLGKMLATDAAARNQIRRQKETGEISAWMASVQLPEDVVTYLIERGRRADRFRVNYYAAALLRADVPAARDFFYGILRNNTGKNYQRGTQFFAAAGLARLGEADGFAWLVANSGDSLPTVSGDWPVMSQNRNLDSCCRAALRQMTGNDSLTTAERCRQWWMQSGRIVPEKRLPLTLSSGRW